MAEFKVGRLLRIFIGEHDTWHGAPLHRALLELLRRENVAGASAFRGIEGFGAHHEIHAAKVFAPRAKLPILIEVVDDEEKIEALIPKIEEMVSEGTVTLERVEYCRFLPVAERKR
jgi:PII-like signaling protein